jgi:alkylation response protein AidB-like acyl-CoA dehydrogenase
MNFDFSEEQMLLKQTAADYLAEHAPLTVCREVLESDAAYSADLWKGAAEMGWLGAVIPEEYGGAGFGHLELAVLAEEIGRSLAPIPFSSSVCLATEAILTAGSDDQRKTWLPQLAEGSAIGTLAVTEKAGQNGAESVKATFEGGVLTGTKIPVLDGDSANFAVVAARTGSGLSLALVDLEADGVTRERVKSIDPSRPVAKLTFDGVRAEALGQPGSAGPVLDRILDRGAVLLAFDQLGAASRSFEITKDFTLGRYAFGRPIASFQAIKHRLADLWCEIELARSNCYYGAWALSNDNEELDVAACLSRVSASDAFDQMTIEMVQLHGGVGYTWEYDCHLFYRRAKLMSAVLGSASHWRDKLIARLEARQAA